MEGREVVILGGLHFLGTGVPVGEFCILLSSVFITIFFLGCYDTVGKEGVVEVR